MPALACQRLPANAEPTVDQRAGLQAALHERFYTIGKIGANVFGQPTVDQRAGLQAGLHERFYTIGKIGAFFF